MGKGVWYSLFIKKKHYSLALSILLIHLKELKKTCYISKLYFGLIFGLFSIYSLIRIHYSVFIIFYTIREK